MQIIIPMSGVGQRFLDAGYSEPKPLIRVDGRPIIEHVVRLFPGEQDFIFICNEEHLRETPMRSVLERIAPRGKILSIPPHKKGPVYAVSQVFESISDRDEVIVNYCDFSKVWNYADFVATVHAQKADGAIAAYRGFHPHMLGTTNYAFMRNDGPWMLEIQEKRPFTDNRMQEYASDGTYYFRSGQLMKKYFLSAMQQELSTKGEFYVSMVYNLLVRDRLNVLIYEIEKMLQWGTPRDLQEYQRWARYFQDATQRRPPPAPQPRSLNLIPLAGRGKRFVDAGYATPKPLVEIDGEPMILRAAASMPPAEKYVFVCLQEHLDAYPLAQAVRRKYPDAKIMGLNGVTEGQACTCALGLEGEDDDAPVFIGACDNGMVWDVARYQTLLSDGTDCVVFTFRHTMASERNPHMYGWIVTDEQNGVKQVSVKKAISRDPYNDHAIVGAFYFRKGKFFKEALERLQRKNIRVNNEFYVDSCINEIVGMGLTAKVFELDHYVCWGTPDDVKVYQYWEEYFKGGAEPAGQG